MLLKSSQARSSSERCNFGTPVTNAFCSWPLSPVLQGPIVATALLRHGKRKHAMPASNSRPTTGRTIIYSQLMDLNAS
uniref:Uncharacterized protein n=1 Tax=Arundo donax TaxID=35708 RepID=A0A0A9FVM4_ARUDO